MSIIPENLDPVFMEHLKAKSRDMGGQTLAEHTWEVLSRLADQYRLRPSLADQIGDARLWHRLYWACFLHDFGKAAQGFQERLWDKPPENDWKKGRHRHEVLSLAFLDWLFPQGHPDRLPVLCIIVSHHKDQEDILTKYGAISRTREQQARVAFLIDQIDPTTAVYLAQWVSEFGPIWQQSLDFPLLEAVEPRNFEGWGTSSIEQALDDYSDYLINFEDEVAFEEETIRNAVLIKNIVYRGMIFTSDHSASAGATRFPSMPLTMAHAHKPLEGRIPRTHQSHMMEVPEGSALLVAPTGSGKTEAAMLWAAQQLAYRPSARLFYTLPYQASMNAMFERLGVKFFGLEPSALSDGTQNIVTIQHSRALLKLYQGIMSYDESDPHKATQIARQVRNLARLNYFPIQIFSPYQMLKAAYSLKGYESLIVDYTNALFIFDEIHAYEPERLAMIIEWVRWLRQNLQARFLVMTATLPPLVEEKLVDALGIGLDQRITASSEDFTASQRHTVQLLDGNLLEYVGDYLGSDLQNNRAVLICCNLVAEAQQVYRLVQERFGLEPNMDVVLLHGRFNGIDRNRKEKAILDRVGVGNKASEATHPFVVVATQVVEVSLDVDFDTLYSDPAPLESLLQRFGRVNRGRESSELCPVHVFREPSNPTPERESTFIPYDKPLVEASLAVLEAYCGGGQPIDEAQVTAMLGDIYNNPDIREKWLKRYCTTAKEFREAILDKMRPYQSASMDTKRGFYEMFDGVEVLPKSLANDYYDTREAKEYLAATGYLVNISRKQYFEFRGYGLIHALQDEDEGYADHIDVPYDPETGLDIDGARQNYRARRDQE